MLKASCLLTVLYAGVFLNSAKGVQLGARSASEECEGLHARVNTWAQNGSWRQASWNDESAMSWIIRLVAISNRYSERSYVIPITLDKTTAGSNVKTESLIQERLIAEKVKLSMCRRAAIFCTGNAEIDFAQECIIVAGGVASIRTARNCIILSRIQTVLDIDQGNLICSQGWVVTSASEKSTIIAPNGARCDQGNGVTLINTTLASTPVTGMDMKFVDSPELKIDGISQRRGIPKLNVKGLVVTPLASIRTRRSRDEVLGVVLECDGVQIVAWTNSRISRDREAEFLNGWTVDYVGGTIAVLRNESEYTVVPFGKE